MIRLQKLIESVKPYYISDDPSHDWAHIGRVAATAKKISNGLDINLPCALAAVYCHDIVNVPKNDPRRKMASELAATEAIPHLIDAGFSNDEIKIVTKAIIEHSFSRGDRPSTLEGAIVQDADRLDALGAIGILRCASVNTLMKARYYDPFDPLAETRELDDKTFMLDHYFVKLFKLPEMMNTESGKREAIIRVNFMKSFIDQLMKEVRSV